MSVKKAKFVDFEVCSCTWLRKRVNQLLFLGRIFIRLFIDGKSPCFLTLPYHVDRFSIYFYFSYFITRVVQYELLLGQIHLGIIIAVQAYC